MVSISDPEIRERLPELEDVQITSSEYFMNNRDVFNFINKLYQPYRDEIMDETEELDCDTMGAGNSFSLMTHQKIVKDYLSHSTPYRGLLLYHGLGSGKTCSSIAIAEGLKTHRMIYILLSILKNELYQLKVWRYTYKNQYWEFVYHRKS